MRRPTVLLTLLLPWIGLGADTDFFAAKVYPIFEKAQCRGCHADDGVASATRLHFPEADASRDRVQAFGLTQAGLNGRFNHRLRRKGMPTVLVEGYSRAAELLALNEVRAKAVHGLVWCNPSSANDSGCRAKFLRIFGGRAFHRPHRSAET